MIWQHPLLRLHLCWVSCEWLHCQTGLLWTGSLIFRHSSALQLPKLHSKMLLSREKRSFFISSLMLFKNIKQTCVIFVRTAIVFMLYSSHAQHIPKRLKKQWLQYWWYSISADKHNNCFIFPNDVKCAMTWTCMETTGNIFKSANCWTCYWCKTWSDGIW